MVDKKDIGKAFKGRLDSLDASPKDFVWDNIVAELDKKEKKKRIIPIWFKVAGIIAIFLIVGKFTMLLNKKKNIEEIIIVSKQNDFNKKQGIEKIVVIDKQNDSLNHTNQIKKNIYKNKNNNNILVGISNQKKEKEMVTHNSLLSNSKNDEINQSLKNSESNQFIPNNKVLNHQNKEENPYNNEQQFFKIFLIPRGVNYNNKLEFTFVELPSLNSELDINFAALDNKSEEQKTNKEFDISIKGTPIYYNSLSDGSSISKIFDKNEKTNNITSSYLVQTSFQITKKTRFRVGISKVNLESVTSNITGSSAVNSQVFVFNNLGFLDDELDGDPFGFAETDPVDNYFQIKQSTNYIEIPLEFSYAIVDRKLKVNMITGLSALILSGNQIIVDGKTIGEVNNLNKLSYTGNLGLGFNYKLTKNLNLIMEPIYKLQFSTYSNNVNYKPYYFGVYSGFVYKF